MLSGAMATAADAPFNPCFKRQARPHGYAGCGGRAGGGAGGGDKGESIRSSICTSAAEGCEPADCGVEPAAAERALVRDPASAMYNAAPSTANTTNTASPASMQMRSTFADDLASDLKVIS